MPAAAVILALIVYIKVVVVKKFVVGFVAVDSGLSLSVSACWRCHPWVEPVWH